MSQIWWKGWISLVLFSSPATWGRHCFAVLQMACPIVICFLLAICWRHWNMGQALFCRSSHGMPNSYLLSSCYLLKALDICKEIRCSIRSCMFRQRLKTIFVLLQHKSIGWSANWCHNRKINNVWKVQNMEPFLEKMAWNVRSKINKTYRGKLTHKLWICALNGFMFST